MKDPMNLRSSQLMSRRQAENWTLDPETNQNTNDSESYKEIQNDKENCCGQDLRWDFGFVFASVTSEVPERIFDCIWWHVRLKEENRKC